MTWLWAECRLAMRALVRNPTYSGIAVLTLALGIGANSAMFSVVHSVLLRPLPYAAPDRLVALLHFGQYPVSPADYFDWKRDARAFEGLGAAQAWSATLSGDGDPELLRAMQVTVDLFPVLGVAPLHGRYLGENAHEVILSHVLWMRRFRGDPAIAGRSIIINGEPYRVAGVMPPSFRFAPFWIKDVEVWAPLRLDDRKQDRGGRSLRVFARLKQGVSREAAQAEVDVLTRRLETTYPDSNTGLTTAVVPLLEKAVGSVRPTLLVLFGTVAFVLLIACVNVANLLLVRASGRRRETAVHLALGASRRRMLLRSTLEGVLLAAAGGALGVLLAQGALALLGGLLPEDSLPRQTEITLDGVVLLFTVVLSLATGALCGFLPTLSAGKSSLHSVLVSQSRAASAGREQKHVRRLLVAVEVALALVLLTGAGLMIRSLRKLEAIQPGFNPRNLIAFTVVPPGAGSRVRFYSELQQRLEAIPGVVSASVINHLPINGDMWTLGLRVAGHPEPPPGRQDSAVYRVVRPRYFSTMGTSVMAGRDFSETDRNAAIVNQALARRYWPEGEALGKQVAVLDGPWLTIVGVVGDLRQRDWTAPPAAEIYLPHAIAETTRSAAMTVVARVRSGGMGPQLAAEVRRFDASVPTSKPLEMEQMIRDQLWQSRLSMGLLTAFSAVALLLAALGIYGVVAYTVAMQTREFGIRLALGATQGRLLRSVLADALPMVGIGLAAGLAASAALSKTAGSLLYQVSTHDPLSFVIATLVLLSVAVAACALPARRAAKLDPADSLKLE